jgi:prepilin-type processing-associated H-X9-DG protein/prepilin-type N-terminal cleavage/methylation domain-containing protein
VVASNSASSFKGRSRTSAFTLVELLVVIGIIALLISILLPSLSRAREQAKRVQCSSNIRQFCAAQLMFANDNKGRIMDVGNNDDMLTNEVTPPNTRKIKELQTMHQGARDIFVNRYGMPREAFYCPSNPEVNTDYNWERKTEGNVCVAGYMMIGGRVLLGGTVKEAEANGFGGFEEVKLHDANVKVIPCKVGQKAFYPVLVTDLTRSYQNSFGAPIAVVPEGSTARSNHIDATASDSTGYMPRGKGGSNVGYLDGHVEWRAQNELGQREHPTQAAGRRQFYQGSNRWYW